MFIADLSLVDKSLNSPSIIQQMIPKRSYLLIKIFLEMNITPSYTEYQICANMCSLGQIYPPPFLSKCFIDA